MPTRSPSTSGAGIAFRYDVFPSDRQAVAEIVASTGFLQFALHRSGYDAAANVAYIVHLMAVVPMLALEVPFSKWSHLAYRPLAMYFSALETRAQEAREASGSPLQVTPPTGAPAPRTAEAA